MASTKASVFASTQDVARLLSERAHELGEGGPELSLWESESE
jgi:hypothetical protein